MVGKRAVKSGFIIEFIVARLPTLQFLGENKVTKIPEQTHPRLSPLKSLIPTPSVFSEAVYPSSLAANID